MTVETTTRKTTQTMTILLEEFTFTFRALVGAPSDIKCTRSNTANATDEDMEYVADLPDTPTEADVLKYIVSVNDDGVGGTVTVAWPSTGSSITIYRETTDTQGSDYEDYNQFPADTVESDFDKRTMVSQEREEDFDRTLSIPITSTVSTILPAPEANAYWIWNATGTAVEYTTLMVTAGTLTRATEADAKAGTNNDKYMTPLRTTQAIEEGVWSFASISISTEATIPLLHNGLATVGTLDVTTKATIALMDVTLGTIGTLTVPTAFASPGVTVQTVYTMSSVLLTGSTQMPQDDSIPQNDEGIELLTLTATPTSTASVLRIEATLVIDFAGNSQGSVAAFQDSTANALKAWSCHSPDSLYAGTYTFIFFMLAGTTSATTIKFRAGSREAGVTYFNGSTTLTTRLYGGVAGSMMAITEIGA